MTWEFTLERVTGIEPTLSAWELDCHATLTFALQISGHHRLSASARSVPVMTPLSGTQRARDLLGVASAASRPAVLRVAAGRGDIFGHRYEDHQNGKRLELAGSEPYDRPPSRMAE